MAGRVYQTLINILVFIIILLNVEFGLINLEKVTLFLR